MFRPNPFWLTLTNIALGAVLVLCVLVIVLGTLCETLSNSKKRRSYRAELNHDMQEMFAGTVPHVASVPAGRPRPTHGLLEPLCRIWRRLFHQSSMRR